MRANVRSLESVRGFRSSMVRFEEDASLSLSALRLALGRVLQWIDHDCPAYWRAEARRCFDRVAETRTQLARKQIMTVAGHRSECIEEKKAYRAAKRDLENAQQKIRLVREWSIKLHRAADEYLSRIGRVEQTLAQDVPKLISLFDRLMTSLEGYVSVQAPELAAVTGDDFPSGEPQSPSDNGKE